MSEAPYRTSFRATLTVAACAALAGLGLADRVEAGLVYTLQSSPGGNQIHGLWVDELFGELIPLPGFPVPTGGNGDGLHHQQFLAGDQLSGRLFAYNNVSGTISAFSFDTTTGALTALPYSPFEATAAGTTGACLAVRPTSLALSFNGQAGTGVEVFLVDGASATAMAGSPFALPAPSGVSCTFVPSGASLLVGGGSAGSSNVAWFNAGSMVIIDTENTGAVSPVSYASDNTRLFLANQSAGQVRAFTYEANSLEPVTGNPFASPLTNHHMGLFNPNGFYMVAGGTDPRVAVFAIGGTGAATTLTQVPGSPFAMSTGSPSLLAQDTFGNILLVGRMTSRVIESFLVDDSTGALSPSGHPPTDVIGSDGQLNGMVFLLFGQEPDGGSGGGAAVSEIPVADPRALALFALSLAAGAWVLLRRR